MQRIFEPIWPYFYSLLYATGLFAFVTPTIGIFLIYSMIGFPLGFLWLLLPPIALITFLYRGLRKVLPLYGAVGVGVAALAIVAVLHMPTRFLNRPIDTQIEALTALDHNDFTMPAKIGVFGLVQRGHQSSAKCEAFCLHVLLSGTAQSVVILNAEINDNPFSPSALGTAFYFGPAATCPQVKFDRRNLELRLPNQTGEDYANAGDLAAQRIAQGDCLLSREASLAEADLVISVGYVRDDTKTAKERSSGQWTEGTKIARMTLHGRTADGGFNEVFLATSGKVLRYGPLLLPMSLSQGWLQYQAAVGRGDFAYSNGPSFAEALTNQLGFDLALSAEDYRSAAQDALIAILDSGNSPNFAQWQAFETYFEGLNPHHYKNGDPRPNGRDAEISVRLINTQTIPLPAALSGIVDYALRNGLLLGADIGPALVTRLEQARDWPDLKLTAEKVSRITALVLGVLPPEMLSVENGLFGRLARNPNSRPHLMVLLQKLHRAGPNAASVLGELAQTGLATKDLDVAVAAVKGLCFMKSNAQNTLAGLDLSISPFTDEKAEAFVHAYILAAAKAGLDAQTVWAVIARLPNSQGEYEEFKSDYAIKKSQAWKCEKT